MKNNCKNFYNKYKHGIPVLVYMMIYLFWWSHLERNITHRYHVIHMAVDDHIPFCEYFVIPYFLWFFYISVPVIFFFFKNREDYYRTLVFLFTGMTVFLIISTFWPNGHHLRMTVMPRQNIFTRLISLLWKTDTPTNLWPSIHVYNSLGIHFAILKSTLFKKSRVLKLCSLVLCISIIMSTVLIKQHSMFDVITAVLMAAFMYLIVYKSNLVKFKYPLANSVGIH